MPRHWSEEEEAILKELAGRYRLEELADIFCQRAKTQLGPSYKGRTVGAVKHKTLQMFGTVFATKANFTKAQLGRILNIPRETVEYWHKQGYLKVDYIGRHSVIRPEALYDFYGVHPKKLFKCSRSGLIKIYGEERVRRLLELKKKEKPVKPPVSVARPVHPRLNREKPVKPERITAIEGFPKECLEGGHTYWLYQLRTNHRPRLSLFYTAEPNLAVGDIICR